MFLEERVDQLEKGLKEAQNALRLIQEASVEEFMTPKETAEFLKCSVQTIHNQVRNGKIEANYSTGMARIPKSQFTKGSPAVKTQIRQPTSAKTRKPIANMADIRKQLFG